MDGLSGPLLCFPKEDPDHLLPLGDWLSLTESYEFLRHYDTLLETIGVNAHPRLEPNAEDASYFKEAIMNALKIRKEAFRRRGALPYNCFLAFLIFCLAVQLTLVIRDLDGLTYFFPLIGVSLIDNLYLY